MKRIAIIVSVLFLVTLVAGDFQNGSIILAEESQDSDLVITESSDNANDSVINALVGYRALSQDYKKGSGENKFVWDVIIHGPIIGLAIDF